MFANILLFVSFVYLATGETPEALQDIQTEFYLPYSETEDVDFSLNRPMGFGCYQWSTDAEDITRLNPTLTDYVAMCGNKLEFQVTPGSPQQSRDFKITAENVDLNSEYNDQDVPAVIEYTFHMRPLARLEVLGLKTELVAGSEPVPFGVAGYDSEDNEFDTLDGLQIGWFIGGKKEVAEFEQFRQVGPIVKVVPFSMGKGAVIAVLNDPNYQSIEPAVLEFSVKSNLEISPDGVYMLEGARVPMKVVESVKTKEGVIQREFTTFGEDPDFTFEIKETDIVSKDKDTSNVTGIMEGETTIFVKNPEGEIIKGMPIRVTKAHSLKIVAHPNPDSKQLTLDNVYEIKVEIYDKNERQIYPSENILCKTTFPKQLDVLEISENGLYAKVQAVHIGVGKIKASLRSVLTDDDEEIEIIPHVKASVDFEVYESVVVKPREVVMPWDDNLKQTYELHFSASGGGKVYTWTVDSDDLAVVDSEGKVSTHSGPGSFRVKAAMAKAPQNFDEVSVYILPAAAMAFKESSGEIATHSPAMFSLQFYTLLPETDEEVMFSDCSDIPYEVTLSDNENFEITSRSERGQTQIYNACTSFNILAKKPGSICKISLAYKEPSTGRTLRAHTSIAAYDTLKALYPKRESSFDKPTVVLAVGSTGKLVFQGGPQPWHGKPSGHFKQIEVDDPEYAKVTKRGQEDTKGAYSDIHIYDVTCIQEGTTKVTFIVGNNPSSTNPMPARSLESVFVKCSMPAKVDLATRLVREEAGIYLAVNPDTSRIMSNYKKDLQMILTVKDKDGNTFDSVESLNFEFLVSDPSIVAPSGDLQTPTTNVENLDVLIQGKPFQVFTPKGKEGEVEIKVRLAGYNEKVVKAANLVDLPPLPKVVDDDDAEIEEDDEFSDHNHSLVDSVDLSFTTDEAIKKIKQKV